MKILWHSNSPWNQSGYSVQTDLFTRLLKEAGHDVVISAFYGLRGRTISANGIPVLPGSLDGWGNDILGAHYQHYKPDVTVALMDLWVVQEAVLRAVPLTAWCPVDHDPIPPAVAERLPLVKRGWAMSRFAEREMRRFGIDVDYVPHGVSIDDYRPIDRAAARREAEVEDDQILVLHVGANKGWPSRKSHDRLLKAWAAFVRRHPRAVLYLHTNPKAPEGIDLEACARFYGVPDTAIRFPDPYRFVRGDYGTAQMNTLYNAADVLVLPSAGGGFEIPLIEAQAAGCPVITTRCTAMAELVGPGYGIAVDPLDGMAYTLQGSEQANVLPSQILDGLEWAFERWHDAALRAASREFAMEYDARRVYRDFMAPALAAQAEGQDGAAARTAARLALRNGKGKAITDYGAEQVADEIEPFLAAMRALGVRSMLEIGAGRQAGLARYCREVLGWDVVSVDLAAPEICPAGVVLVAPNELATFDRTFDLVFLDAEHEYDGLRRQHAHYARFAAKAVAIHDIASPVEACQGAVRYWRDIRPPGYQEHVSANGARAGIGWYTVTHEPEAGFAEWEAL